jgi:hypothetical protein
MFKRKGGECLPPVTAGGNHNAPFQIISQRVMARDLARQVEGLPVWAARLNRNRLQEILVAVRMA